MRYIASAVLMASLAVTPAFVAAQSSSTKPATKSDKSASAEHSVRGVVKSIDSTSMLLTTNKKGGDTTFVLAPSTQREGTLAVGSTVSVRYHEQGGSKIATAVIAQPAKEATTTKKKS
jgi:hypothetical protein